MTEPFIKRKAGDFITAQDWNEIQIQIRDFLNRHTHNGEAEQGTVLNGNALEKIAALTVKDLSVDEISAAGGKSLTITGNTNIGFKKSDAKLSVNGGVNIGGAADPGDKNLNVAGAATIGKNLTVKGSTTLTKLSVTNQLTATGNVGIGTNTPKAKLDVNGSIFAGNSDLYFTQVTHDYTGIGNTKGYAAIENAKDYDALMILGRAGTKNGRCVKLWDYLQVNGKLEVTAGIYAGNSDLYFTQVNHDHTGYGNTKGHAAIENAKSHDALMILGRAGTKYGRCVKLWDYLQVNGSMDVTGNIKAKNFKITWGKVVTTGWLNSFDKVLNYEVPAGCVMVGLYSEHSNSREDRRFKVRYRSIKVG